jgi:hypothetical protein
MTRCADTRCVDASRRMLPGCSPSTSSRGGEGVAPRLHGSRVVLEARAVLCGSRRAGCLRDGLDAGADEPTARLEVISLGQTWDRRDNASPLVQLGSCSPPFYVAPPWCGGSGAERCRGARLNASTLTHHCTSAADHGAALFETINSTRHKNADTLRGFVRRAGSLQAGRSSGLYAKNARTDRATWPLTTCPRRRAPQHMRKEFLLLSGSSRSGEELHTLRNWRVAADTTTIRLSWQRCCFSGSGPLCLGDPTRGQARAGQSSCLRIAGMRSCELGYLRIRCGGHLPCRAMASWPIGPRSTWAIWSPRRSRWCGAIEIGARSPTHGPLVPYRAATA